MSPSASMKPGNPSQQGLKHPSDCDSRQFMEHPSQQGLKPEVEKYGHCWGLSNPYQHG